MDGRAGLQGWDKVTGVDAAVRSSGERTFVAIGLAPRMSGFGADPNGSSWRDADLRPVVAA